MMDIMTFSIPIRDNQYPISICSFLAWTFLLEQNWPANIPTQKGGLDYRKKNICYPTSHTQNTLDCKFIMDFSKVLGGAL